MPALGTTGRLHPLLQPPPKLPYNLELGGWHSLSHPVESQGSAPAARAAGPFHDDAPLQPAHPLCLCCCPVPAPDRLTAILPPGRCWVGCVLGHCWGQGAVPFPGPLETKARACRSHWG